MSDRKPFTLSDYQRRYGALVDTEHTPSDLSPALLAETVRMSKIEARREQQLLASAESEVARRRELQRESEAETARHEWRRRELARRQAEIAAQAKKPVLVRKAGAR
jgi:hypothetical protein